MKEEMFVHDSTKSAAADPTARPGPLRARPVRGRITHFNFNNKPGSLARVIELDVRRSSVSSKLGNPFNMHRDETKRDHVCEAFDTMLRKIIDSKGEDDNAETELWAARQTHLEARLRPDPANRRPNTKPGERWDELVRLADALRQGYDIHLGCVCRPNRCHAESIVREVTALA